MRRESKREKKSEKEKEKQQLAKLWSICWRTRQAWLKGKKKPSRRGREEGNQKHSEREEKVNGWCGAEGWLKSCEGQCPWVRQVVAGAGLRDNKGKWRADGKLALCHLPPMEKRNQIQPPSFINQREGQLIKKNTHHHTHIHNKHTHKHVRTSLFFPDCLKRPKFCVRVYVWVSEKRNCI